jgi:hypothetical protein
MDKVIKEFKNNNSNNEDLTYQLGYDLYENKVYPRIEIYKNEVLLSGGYWCFGASVGLSNFIASDSSSYSNSYISTIKGLFNKLRKYNELSQNIEQEYESLFIMYKLNNFNELVINT